MSRRISTYIDVVLFIQLPRAVTSEAIAFAFERGDVWVYVTPRDSDFGPAYLPVELIIIKLSGNFMQVGGFRGRSDVDLNLTLLQDP